MNITKEVLEQTARKHNPRLWDGAYRDRLLFSKSPEEADQILHRQQSAEMLVAYNWLWAFATSQGLDYTFDLGVVE